MNCNVFEKCKTRKVLSMLSQKPRHSKAQSVTLSLKLAQAVASVSLQVQEQLIEVRQDRGLKEKTLGSFCMEGKSSHCRLLYCFLFRTPQNKKYRETCGTFLHWNLKKKGCTFCSAEGQGFLTNSHLDPLTAVCVCLFNSLRCKPD